MFEDLSPSLLTSYWNLYNSKTLVKGANVDIIQGGPGYEAHFLSSDLSIINLTKYHH